MITGPLKTAALKAAVFFLFPASILAQSIPDSRSAVSAKWLNGNLLFEQRVWAASPVFAGKEAWVTLEASNESSHPITIEKAIVRSPIGLVSGLPQTLRPGEKGSFKIGLETFGMLGELSSRVGIYTDESPVVGTSENLAPYRLVVTTFVRTSYVPERFMVDFGNVDRSKGGRVQAKVSSRDVMKLSAIEIADAAGWVTAKAVNSIDPQQLILDTHLKPDAPSGILVGTLELTTNVADQPVLYIPYRANVFGDIVPDTVPLDYGLMSMGQPAFHFIELSSRTGTAFSVEKVTDPKNLIRAYEVSPCVKKRPDCSSLKLTFYPQRTGPQSGEAKVLVKQNGSESDVPVPYSAVVSRNKEAPSLIDNGSDDD
ncbi:hypothetical protein [Dokdonella sp.]|uniref:hypothetical protein n=1 Tax=Dokdonella sp. TaxID=2291710 RepID=UPI003C54C77A